MTDVTNSGGQTAERGSPLSGIQSTAQNVASELGVRAGAAREWATHQSDVARQTVVEKPFASAGAAFAAGLVFGLLLARR